ncbi:hypothetical protein K2W90_02715 [Candidatus Babeliales bacterium]|nr:hypothetical protein [Candidatus Babeliales bacterium]
MKKITFLSIFALITVAFSNLSATTQGPVLYFNKCPLLIQYGTQNASWVEGHPLCSLESADLRKRLEKIHQDYPSSQFQEICQKIEEENKALWRKTYAIVASIVKRLGASAVATYEHQKDYDGSNCDAVSFFYIDPAYDITKEVIATLNKEYQAKK